MPDKILVVDDEQEIADLVTLYLQNDGYEVYTCYDAHSALTYVAKMQLQLAILDVMLPDMSGFALCQQIRQTHMFPIIMLTAKGEDLDKITGLTLGADDYMTKPFNPLELVARVKTQLRRSTRYNQPASAPAEVQEYDFRGLQISKTNHKCILFGDELSLTPLEFSILWYLCQHRGAVVSSEELFQAVWGERYMDGNNTVMTHIDIDTFSVYPEVVRPDVNCWTLTPDGHGGLKRTQESTLLHAIEKALGIDQVRLITTGGDAFEAEREQWNDANNVLTLRPGVVVGYERNIWTNEKYDKAGITVLPIPGDELGRGRGGARCMSCPLHRDGI